MTYRIQEVVGRLEEARLRAGVTQRELSRKTGIPQGHLSRILRGTVDPRTSSVVEIARALGLELVPVSRQALPAILAVLRSAETEEQGEDEPRPAYSPENLP